MCRLSSLGFVAAMLLMHSGCQPIIPPTPSASNTGPVKVALIQPQRRVLTRNFEQPGTIQAYEETQLVARLQGYVKAVYADIGQRVKGPKYNSAGRLLETGQLLAVITVPELEEEARQKEALEQLAAAEVQQMKKSLLAADAQVASAEALMGEARAGVNRAQAFYDRWESESRRMTQLATTGTVDNQTRDETQKQFQVAAASREEAQAHLTSASASFRKAQADRGRADADVLVAEAKVSVAQAEVRRLRAMLDYTRITAPFDGIVTRRRINTGDYLQTSPSKGEGIFTISRLDPVRIVVQVPEGDAGLVRDQDEVKLAIQALKGQPIVAKITRTSWALELGSRTLRAEIDLPNADGRFRPGMYVYATMAVKLPEAWTLPASAIAKQGDQFVCFAVEGGKAKRLPVRIEAVAGGFFAVTAMQEGSAWKAVIGAEKIAEKANGLTDGQAVTVE